MTELSGAPHMHYKVLVIYCCDYYEQVWSECHGAKYKLQEQLTIKRKYMTKPLLFFVFFSS